MKLPKLLDNKQNGRIVDELREYLQKGSKLSVISAYFTIHAYASLRKELSKIDNLRLIFTEPSYVTKDNELHKEFYIHHNNYLFGNEFEIKLRNEMHQSAIAKECAQWIKKKVEIKSLKQKNSAQPRLFCIDNKKDSLVIAGSVDFSTDGLGIMPSSRVDSNTALYGNDFTHAHLQLFDQLWKNETVVEDVKAEVLAQMNILYKENTPEFIYFVSLYHIFRSFLGELTEENIIKTRTGFKDSVIWNKLYQFQRDGVMGAIDKIEKYNGCIIADSVGLGKTFTALAIIKYYELRNDRVLVLSPNKLRENWSIYTQNDKRNILAHDRFNFDVLSHTDLSRYSGTSGDINLATIHWENYDLIVIDESHNFRNNNPTKGRVTRYERLMNEVIRSGVKTKALLLSATPVNNKMNDIKNQIAFITEGKNDAFESLGLKNIELVLKKAQTVFNKWSQFPEAERSTDSFIAMMHIDYFKLLDTISIARSRRHIEKYYNLAEIGKFPKRLRPINKYSGIDTQEEFPSIMKVNRLMNSLSLAIYCPLGYILSTKRPEYERKYDMRVGTGHSVFKQADRETHLIGLMRVGLLKRMESSIYSFGLTVKKIVDKVDATLMQITNADLSYNPYLGIENIDLDDADMENMIFGNKIKVLLQDMDLLKWRQALESDRDKLLNILGSAKKITAQRDNKLQELKSIIKYKKQNPINPQNKKIIVFTAFADTADYLYNNLAAELEKEGIYTAKVIGSGNNISTIPLTQEQRKTIKITDLNTTLTLFSPRSKECSKVFPHMDKEIDILIATDCISEGQNLQDCDYLINYDIHWNPVRIIQRFGRIDRIGSTNESIQLVNFWPMQDLDAYIKLAHRVKGKMVLLDVSATGEENLIEDGEREEMKDLEYRKNQLQRMQNEVIDLEDISGAISITDLTFSDFKIDLMEYMKIYKKELDEAPIGLYAITNIEYRFTDILKSGVIFIIRQVQGKDQGYEQNSFSPYYLIYIADDGEIQLSFLQSKKILDIYKKLSHGKSELFHDLIAIFNKETNDGHNMLHYSSLLKKAIENLVGKKEEIGMASLFSRGGTSLQPHASGVSSSGNFFSGNFSSGVFSSNGIEDFELISFLILK